MFYEKVVGRLKREGHHLSKRAVEFGLPPGWIGYRWLQQETVHEYLTRHGDAPGKTNRYVTIHTETFASNPLPRNIPSRDLLPRDRGWWGFSFRDVPFRKSTETYLATLPDCRVVPFLDPQNHQFYAGILNSDERALDLSELAFRHPGHTRRLGSASPRKRLQSATWIIERVYHNYSHFLTAHLPKFLLLRSRDALSEVYIPETRPSFFDEALRLVGIDPQFFPTFDPALILEVEKLTILGTDRFRPELLHSVRDSIPYLAEQAPFRRVYISRSRAPRRRLRNEDTIWPKFERAGFQRVFMEDLTFRDQVRLMQETRILCAPHGAGLTNMIFCPPGTHVMEIADLSFPNPNFYALASAMDHHYWILAGKSVGEGHPLEQDLLIQPGAIDEILTHFKQEG